MTQTMEQLKNRSWTSFRKAADALKAAGFPVKGEDYEIREAIKGSFQIMPLEVEGAATVKAPETDKPPFTISIALSNAQKIEETARTLVGAIRKRNAMNVEHGKMGMRPKIFAVTADGTGVVQLGPWTSMDKAAAAMKDAGLPMSGPEYDIRERAKGSVSLAFLPEPDNKETTTVTTTTKAAATKKAAAKPAPKKGAAKAPAAKKAAAVTAAKPETAKVTPVEQPKDDAPANDMTALDADRGPYVLRLAHWPQHDILAGALKMSIAMGEPVMILERKGEVVRTIDGRLAKPGARKAAGTRKAAAGTRTPRTSGKTAEVVKLLMRPKGAKMDELTKITGWSFGRSYLDKLAASRAGTLQMLGDKHWKLTAQAQA